MKAVWYDTKGPASEVLTFGEIEDPKPGPGEVLVRLATSAIIPLDVAMRAAGRGPMAFPRIIPHNDGAGIIEAAGAGVPSSRVGERVWIWGAQWQRAFGTAAELVALPLNRVYPLPDHTSFAEAACFGSPSLTAYYGVFSEGPVTGKSVLVTGGAGRVGNYAIQFAKRGGATVIATVSSAEKGEAATTAGADHVIDYRIEDVAARVKEFTGDQGVNRIVEIDFGANLAVSAAILKTFGVIVTYASHRMPEPSYPFYALQNAQATIHHMSAHNLDDDVKAKAFDYLGRELEAGGLYHAIGARLPLAETAAAQEAVERGSFGAVIVEVNADASA